MKKFMMLATILVAGLFIMPNVHAEDTWYGNVEASIGNDTLKSGSLPQPVNDKTAEVTVTYDTVTLQYVAEESNIGKTGTSAWLGVKVNAPTEAKENIKTCTEPKTSCKAAQYYPEGDKENPRNFFDKKDGGNGESGTPYYIYLYNAVTKEKLEEAAKNGVEVLKLGTWYFDWDGNGTYEQKVNLAINVKTVTLKSLEGEKELFTPIEAEKLINEYKQSQQQVQPEEEQKEENNPNTSDINLYLLLSLIAVSSCGIAYTVKRRFN